jgi:hypothetical protein
VVPPLHHEIVTFRLPAGGPADLRDAQRRLAQALAGLDQDYASSPAGLGVTVGWGLPYFRGPVATAGARPRPGRSPRLPAAGRPVSVLLDAIRFPSDTSGVRLEQNDAVLLLRSDNPAHIHDAHERLVGDLDVWQPTSIRRGFVGGGFDGGEGLPHKLARGGRRPGCRPDPAAGRAVPGIHVHAESVAGARADREHRDAGLLDGGPGGYFRQGTTMHVSHIFEDLAILVPDIRPGQRAATVFGPTRKRARGHA